MGKPVTIGQSHALVQAIVNSIHWDTLDGAQVQKIIDDPTSLETDAFIRNGCKLPVGSAATGTLARMIADAGFRSGRFDTGITEEHFPLDKEGAYDASGLLLFGGDREWTINEVEAAIKTMSGRLEGLVRGLAYLKANPGVLKDGPIVFPASSWVHSCGGVYVPYAGLDGGGPYLSLIWDDGRDDRLGRRCRFLVSGK